MVSPPVGVLEILCEQLRLCEQTWDSACYKEGLRVFCTSSGAIFMTYKVKHTFT